MKKIKLVSALIAVCMILTSVSVTLFSVSAQEEVSAVVSANAGSWKQNPNGQWQYIENGSCVKGWNFIDNNWYYFDDNAIMKTGWLESPIAGNPNSNWYYLNPNGAMAKGWKNDIPGFEGKWFYFEPAGDSFAYKQGMMYWSCDVSINGKSYGFEINGVMKANTWSNIGVTGSPAWVFYGTDGAAVTGWNRIDGKWYCFDNEGIMYRNTRTPDGYWVDENGVWK